MAYLTRIKNGNYTDSDVGQFYIKERFNHGPFIREIGDFIAHPKRDKGGSFNTIINAYSQFAFAQVYQLGSESKKQKPLNHNGACEWWMKPYFESKIEEYSSSDLLKEIGMSKTTVKAEILSWFAKKDKFPTEINAKNVSRFYRIASLFCRTISIRPAFTIEDAYSELLFSFKKLGIKNEICEEFIVATAVVINNLEIELHSSVTAKISIDASRLHCSRISNCNNTGKADFFDRSLIISIITNSQMRDELLDIRIDLIDTKINILKYFNESLFIKNSVFYLDENCNLQFDSKLKNKVTVC
ncbi:hypothetical protein [Niveispirillum irakense]|uniref:hypothetical protein n=1 Tax=Niveispirillum irakense TaxID=34011 RepID=UPI0012B5595C|nr:hypothetical protein [Niveispirillum irakense]